MTRWFSSLACLLALVALAGCGSGKAEDKSGKVTGTIKLDGAPLPDGKVMFAVAGKPPREAVIKNGSYEADALVGPNTVSFYVGKQVTRTGAQAKGPGADQPQETNALPDKYHSSSKITLDVKEGPNPFDYDIKTK